MEGLPNFRVRLKNLKFRKQFWNLNASKTKIEKKKYYSSGRPNSTGIDGVNRQSLEYPINILL